MNIAGIMAKYFATSLAMLNVVSAPRVISNCLPISTISISLVGSLSRSTMLPASRAACVPVCIATPTSAFARSGAAHRNQPAFRLDLSDIVQFMLRRCLGDVVIDAGFRGDGGGGDAVVAGDHDGADAHVPPRREALFNARLDDVLQLDDAEQTAIGGDRQRRGAGAAD